MATLYNPYIGKGRFWLGASFTNTRVGFVMFACSASWLGLQLICPLARRVRLSPNSHRRFCQSSLRTKARIAFPPTQLRKFEGLSCRSFSCSFSFSKDPIDAFGSELFGRSSSDLWEADATSSISGRENPPIPEVELRNVE